MVVYTPPGTGQYRPSDRTASLHSPHDSSNSPVTVHSAARDSIASSKTTQPNSAFKMASKVFNYLKPEGRSQRSILYKEGNRVVVYSMKDQRPITATVRWTGGVQMSKQSGLPSMIFAGLEPVRSISNCLLDYYLFLLLRILTSIFPTVCICSCSFCFW